MTSRRIVEKYKKDGTETLTLHGTMYELWYDEGPISTSWRFIDINPENTRETPILPLSRWINMVMSTALGK